MIQKNDMMVLHKSMRTIIICLGTKRNGINRIRETPSGRPATCYRIPSGV